jgi:hypothetical protein
VSSKKEILDLAKKEARLKPRFFLARMISSKRRIEGSVGRVVSRSWMNSWNAIYSVSKSGLYLESRGVLTLCLPKHGNILAMLIRQAPRETIHIESEQSTRRLLLIIW